ncbi:MAG: carbonic anhydrase family protein [Proteobacteria bacterium]|nr:carbonic anhydrase family protein [Pseudomonadota bacterium]
MASGSGSGSGSASAHKPDEHVADAGSASGSGKPGSEHDKPVAEDEHKDKEAKDEHKDAKDAKDAAKDAAPHQPPHFAYEGADGPAEWGSLDPSWTACAKGTAQSPIDITPRAGTASPIEFHYKSSAATLVDNGHTLQVSLAPGSSIVIDKHTYELVQFHIHTPSEHVIAGEQYPLEVHLVHKDADGKLAVIGVLYDVGPEARALSSVWASWPSKHDVEKKLKKPFDPTVLLPETRTVYRYSGSLTTPPCTEGVVWNVMRRTMTDSKLDFTLLGLRMKPNTRPVQPLGDRKIE